MDRENAFIDLQMKLIKEVKPLGIEIETIPIRIDDPDLEIGIGIPIPSQYRDRDRDRIGGSRSKLRKSRTVDRIKNLTPLLL